MAGHKMRAAVARPLFISSSLLNFSSSTSLQVSAPTAIAAGNLLVGLINCNAGVSLSLTAPSGWSVVNSSANRFIIYKEATGSEPATYTFTLSASPSVSTCSILNYTLGNLDAVGSSSNAGTDLPAPSVTVAKDKSLVLLIVSGNTGNNTVTTPSGWTKRTERTTVASQVIFERYFNAGATGDIAQDGTFTAARSNLVAISPG